MNERQEARETANRWLDGRMNPMVEMVPGDSDCGACVLARQYMRALDKISQLMELIERLTPAKAPDYELARAHLADHWPASVQ